MSLILSSEEIDDLALFFSKRTDAPNGDDDVYEGWRATLAEANAVGGLPRLVRAHARQNPDDANLQHMVEVFGQDRHFPMWAAATIGASGVLSMGMALTLAGLVAIAAEAPQLVTHVAALTASFDDVQLADLQPQDAAIEPTTLEQLSHPAENPEPVEVEVAPEVTLAAVAEPVETPKAPEVAVAAPPPAERPAVKARKVAKKTNKTNKKASGQKIPKSEYEVASVVGDWQLERSVNPGRRCKAKKKDDSIVGYWFFGKDAPGDPGDLLHMNTSRNVRADFPDHHNDYNAKAPVQCILFYGDVVKLSQPAIKVPGDYYWVPLVAGDLIGEKPAQKTGSRATSDRSRRPG